MCVCVCVCVCVRGYENAIRDLVGRIRLSRGTDRVLLEGAFIAVYICILCITYGDTGTPTRVKLFSTCPLLRVGCVCARACCEF